MIDKSELCEKIRSIYPDIGECGIAINVEYDGKNKRWIVDLKNGKQPPETSDQSPVTSD